MCVLSFSESLYCKKEMVNIRRHVSWREKKTPTNRKTKCLLCFNAAGSSGKCSRGDNDERRIRDKVFL